MTPDMKFMRRAIALAERGIGTTSPNPCVGAVVVKNGRIIGEGWHQKAGEAHAELIALKKAGKKAAGSTLYVTLEPCSTHGKTPPCTEAILASKVKRVVIGAVDPNPVNRGKAAKILRAKGIKVEAGVLREECEELNLPFWSWMTRQRPWVTLKLAASLDGRIATRTGDSKWITSPESRDVVQRIRYAADAILVGANTIRVDNPRLDVRAPKSKPILKVILSTGSPISPRSRVYESGDPVWIMSAKGADALKKLLFKLGQHGVLHLLVEGGGETAASFLEAGLVDDVHWFTAPKIIGGRDAVPSVAGAGAKQLADAVTLKDVRVRNVGPDVWFYGKVDHVHRNR